MRSTTKSVVVLATILPASFGFVNLAFSAPLAGALAAAPAMQAPSHPKALLVKAEEEMTEHHHHHYHHHHVYHHHYHEHHHHHHHEEMK